MPQNYEHINRYEREIIAEMRRNGEGWNAIGERLGRAGSSVWREYQKNRSEAGTYLPHDADAMAEKRRHIPRKPRRITGEIKLEVDRGLKQYWSPDQIEGRSKLYGMDMASLMTIYNYLGSEDGQELRKYLRGPSRKRRQNKQIRKRIHDRVMISERSSEAENRSEAGHFEGDTIRGPMTSSACILTMVDRKTRYLVAKKVNSRKAKDLNYAAENALDGLTIKTLTVDNGMEFASHKELSGRIDAEIYFAHSGCPWERGTNENTNGLIRQFFPKGMDLEGVGDDEIEHVTGLINNRPRKMFGYRTAIEMVAECMSKE